MRALLVLFIFLTSIAANARVDLAYFEQALSGYNTIIFETRGSRGGNGDVAELYLMALEFIERFHLRIGPTFGR